MQASTRTPMLVSIHRSPKMRTNGKSLSRIMRRHRSLSTWQVLSDAATMRPTKRFQRLRAEEELYHRRNGSLLNGRVTSKETFRNTLICALCNQFLPLTSSSTRGDCGSGMKQRRRRIASRDCARVERARAQSGRRSPARLATALPRAQTLDEPDPDKTRHRRSHRDVQIATESVARPTASPTRADARSPCIHSTLSRVAMCSFRSARSRTAAPIAHVWMLASLRRGSTSPDAPTRRARAYTSPNGRVTARSRSHPSRAEAAPMRTIRENAHDQSIGNGFFSTIEVVERAAGRVIDDLFCSASRNVVETFALDDPGPALASARVRANGVAERANA